MKEYRARKKREREAEGTVDYNFFNSRHVQRARKEHQCTLCRKVIPVGTAYEYEAGVYGGYFFSISLHTSCQDLIQEYCSDVGENEWDVDCISDWFHDKYCRSCKNYWPVCSEGACEYWDTNGGCPDRTSEGRCPCGDCCDRLDGGWYGWCESYTPEDKQ